MCGLFRPGKRGRLVVCAQHGGRRAHALLPPASSCTICASMDEVQTTYFNFARDVMERWARQRPEATALWIVQEETRRELKFTFAELAELQCRAAAFFADLGIERGDRVLVILPRVPQWWIAMLGLVRLGAVPIPGTPLLTAKDISYRLD